MVKDNKAEEQREREKKKEKFQENLNSCVVTDLLNIF